MLSFAIALMGCASTQVTADWDRTTNFAKYDTYAWMDTPRMQAMQQATLFDRRLRDAVEQQLAAKGLRQARTKTSADVLLVYDAGLHGKIDVRQWGYFGRQLDVTEVREGTLLIDVVDAHSNSLVWRATARAEIKDADLSSEKIAKAVAKMFEKFPGA
jgi:hypothetical protein